MVAAQEERPRPLLLAFEKKKSTRQTVGSFVTRDDLCLPVNKTLYP
jgi:hypothetical protein